jgi:hypothetical protein
VTVVTAVTMMTDTFHLRANMAAVATASVNGSVVEPVVVIAVVVAIVMSVVTPAVEQWRRQSAVIYLVAAVSLQLDVAAACDMHICNTHKITPVTKARFLLLLLASCFFLRLRGLRSPTRIGL